MTNRYTQSDADWWRQVCVNHLHGHATEILADQWCRRILEQASMERKPVGIKGYRWRFADGSALIVTSETVFVTS